ncbi:MAG: ATP-dependent Clp protease adaptor ClpS [Bacteroidales bacterium]|nr:ATP-dependent Clp protease adaptor ClpS [Bacteroidales bacterium]
MVIEKRKKLEQNQDKEAIRSLYLINDNVNTFEYVLECLMSIFEFSEEQAYQITLITHLRGTCILKTGSPELLSQYQEELRSCNLSSKIE